MKDFSKISRTALNAMEEYAKKTGATGVGICLCSEIGSDNEWQSKMRIMGASKSVAEDGSGYNFIAIAYSKAAESIETGENSGHLKRMLTGEFGYRGCVVGVVGDMKVMTAFSGCTEDIDFEIAQVGLSEVISN